MRVIFGDGEARIEEAEALDRFEARALCRPSALDQALEGVGRREGQDHVWISRAWLMARGPADPDWRARFEGMVAYAAKRGWVDEDGALRAHLVWETPVAP